MGEYSFRKENSIFGESGDYRQASRPREINEWEKRRYRSYVGSKNLFSATWNVGKDWLIPQVSRLGTKVRRGKIVNRLAKFVWSKKTVGRCKRDWEGKISKL